MGQDSNTCKNCQTPLEGPICHQCGQRSIGYRWTVPIILKQFVQQVTNLEKGFLFTIKGLFFFPGTLIKEYWNGKTISYYNPFRYVLILTALNILLYHWLGIDDLLQDTLQPEMLETELGSSRIEAADQRFDSWMNILVLLLIPINSLSTKWLFRKQGQNYAEHLIMNTYILGHQSLFGILSVWFFYLFPSTISLFLIFSFLIGWLYNAYVFKQLFQNNWTITIFKALLVGIIGIIAYSILVVLFSSIAILFS